MVGPRGARLSAWITVDKLLLQVQGVQGSVALLGTLRLLLVYQLEPLIFLRQELWQSGSLCRLQLLRLQLLVKKRPNLSLVWTVSDLVLLLQS